MGHARTGSQMRCNRRHCRYSGWWRARGVAVSECLRRQIATHSGWNYFWLGKNRLAGQHRLHTTGRLDRLRRRVSDINTANMVDDD